MDINLELQTKKLELIHWLSSIDDLRIIDKISKIRKEEKSWWNDIADAEKKMIESFIIELTRSDTISAPFLEKYVIFNRKQESVNKIKRSLNEIKTNYLTNREKYLKPNIDALDFIPVQSNAKYYGIQIDNDRSLNFAIESGKISSISLFQTSSYNTIVFF